MKVCSGYAFRRRYENRLLIWVLKRALCLKWQMPLWQRISQTLKVEVGFGSSVWRSFFHLKKGPSKRNFNTWHAALPPLFQPCKQRNNQWQQREGRQEKHVKQLAFPFIQCWAAPQGWGFLLFIIILFLLHIFLFSARAKLLFSTESSLEVGYLIREPLCVSTKSQIFSSALYSTGWIFSPAHPAATQK